MKKTICLLLVLLMTLTAFTGCKEETPQASTGATEIPTQSTEEPASRVVNGVYASCGDYVYSIRTKANACIKFYLMTEKPLPKDATITVDTESSYWSQIKDKTPETMKTVYTYPTGLVMWAERGVDYDKYFTLQEEEMTIQKKYNAGTLTREEYDEAMRGISEELDPLYEIGNEVRDYGKKTAPPFYFYHVELYVKHKETEVIKECQLVAGDMSRPIQIGEITQYYQHNLNFPGENVVGTGAKQYVAFATLPEFPNVNFEELFQTFKKPIPNIDFYPFVSYTDSADVTFEALNDITLTEYYSVDGVECFSAEVIIINPNNKQHVYLTWESGTELRIRKGELVLLRIYVNHPNFREAECAIADELRIAYTDANGGGYLRKNYFYLRQRPLMEMYLWAFKGLDTKPYCERYYEYCVFLRDNPIVVTQ